MVWSVLHISLVLLQIILTVTEEMIKKSCTIDDTHEYQCSFTEICIASICECLPGYTRLNNRKNCTTITTSTSTYGPPPSSPLIANHNYYAAILIPIAILIVIIFGSILLVRKYNLMNWVRNKLNQHRDTSYYDEVMIGQDDDDPPLVGV